MNTLVEKEITAPAAANVPNGPWTMAIRYVELDFRPAGTFAWRVQCESPNAAKPEIVMTWPKYEQALRTFNEMQDELIAVNYGVGKPRRILCSYCKNDITDNAHFPQSVPQRAFDFGYCGCGGWD